MLQLADEGIIYARVSTIRQVTEGHGIDSQIKACLAFAKDNDVHIVKIFTDPAKSGGNLDRPGVKAFLAFLKKRKKYTYVFIDDIARLTRNSPDYYPLKSQIADNKGILKDTKGLINEDTTIIGAFVEHVMVGQADLERRMNRERVISRQTQRIMHGHWVFPEPVGYIFADKELKIVEERAKLVRKIFEDFAAGRFPTYKAIKDSQEAKLLINPKRNTTYRFKDDTIKKMLTNKLYIGKVEFKKWGISERDGNHEAIVDEKTFNKVQLQLKRKGKKKYSKLTNEEFPMKGDLVCGNCKTNLVYSKARGRSKSYPYYRCNTSKDFCDNSPKNIRTEKIHEDFLTLLEGAAINPKILKLADKVLEDIYLDKSKQHKGIQLTNRSRLDDLVNRKAKLIKTLINSENESVIGAIEEEINKIDLKINEIEAQEDNMKGIQTFKLQGIKLLEDPKSCWKNGNYHEKKMIFDFIFEEPLEILHGEIGTAPYAHPYRLLRKPVARKEGMVELGGIYPLLWTKKQ